MVEKAPFTDETSLSELRPKSLFYLQGFTWPLSAQTYWIQDHLGIPGGSRSLDRITRCRDLAMVGVVAAYALSAWRLRRWELLVIPGDRNRSQCRGWRPILVAFVMGIRGELTEIALSGCDWCIDLLGDASRLSDSDTTG